MSRKPLRDPEFPITQKNDNTCTNITNNSKNLKLL